MPGRQNLLIANERATAKADIVVHRAIEADLPRVLALVSRVSPYDHIRVGLSERLTGSAANEAGKQQQL